MKRKQLMRFALLSVALGVTTVAWSDDWPQWRGLNRDAKVADFRPPGNWPEQLTQKWNVQVGDGVATPALVGDRLYVFTLQGDSEVTRCLDAETGREIWSDRYAAQGADGPARSFPGPRSSPAVGQGKVITYGVRGMLSCLDAETGKVIWRKPEYIDSVPRFFTSSSPIIHRGLCIAQLGGEQSGTIVAFDLDSGETVWNWAEDGTAYASPVLMSINGTSVVIAETDDKLVGLDASGGNLLWQIPYPVTGRRGYNAATPVVSDQTIIYTGSNRGAVAVQLSAKGNVLSARELWSNQDNSVQYNTPVLKDGLLYGLSDEDVLFCINARDGQTLWTSRVGQRGRGRSGYGSIVDAGSVLFALTPQAQLIVFEPSAEEFQQIASYKVSDEETHAYPIIAGNRVFIKDSESVTLWNIE